MPTQRPIVRPDRRERGQVLVLVAICLMLLILFVGLAVDVGYWYGQRRHMQNAADAGALAGAWEICFGSRANVTSAAVSYAVSNGADPDMVEVTLTDPDGTPNPTEGSVVVVRANVMAPTFFVRILFPEVRVTAIAAANCDFAHEGCGMWPVAFDLASYDDPTLMGECNWDPTLYDEDGRPIWDPAYVANWPPPTGINEKSQFILWAGDNQTWDPRQVEKHCSFQSHPELPGYPTYTIGDVIGGSPMDPGSRGWVALRLLPGYEIPEGAEWDDCKSTNNCGSSALNCWLQYGYIGQISIGDCLATEDGQIDNSLRTYASMKEGQAVSVILYDHPGSDPEADCDPSYNSATCNGSKAYHVAGIGCIRVEHVFDGKNCGATCSGGRTHDYIQWYRYQLGGTGALDREYTRRSAAEDQIVWYEGETPVYGYGGTPPGYGFNCRLDEKDKWYCENQEPLTFSCPSPSTGIVATKLCACPPTYCTPGAPAQNTTIKGVGLVGVPAGFSAP